MRAIVVADIHGDREALLNLKNSVMDKDVEYFFLLGDYSPGFKDQAENEEDVNFILEALADYKVKAIPGNCDQKKALDTFQARNANMHNTVLEFPGVAIMGFGGSNPTPFGTPFEYSEEEIYTQVKNLLSSTKNKKTILMVHSPPKDTACDVIKNGAHVGSSSLRKVIEEDSPDLVLCSHIHESAGKEDKIRKTRVLNVGRISEGWAYMLDIDGEDIDIEFYTG